MEIKKSTEVMISWLMLLIGTVIMTPAYASIGGQLESAGQGWLIPILQGVMVVGIIVGAILMGIGNPEGKDKIKMVLFAGVIGLSSTAIVGQISEYFGR